MNKVKDAFFVDLNLLLEGFANYASLSFDLFCTEWKRRKFQHIYSALINDIEIITATSSYFNITKQYLVDVKRSLYERVGSLYLLYTLYFKQPTEEFCKIKLLLHEWILLKQLIASLQEREDGKQSVYIFWKLISCNALRFVENDTEYICENVSANKMDAENVNIFVLPVEQMLKGDINEIKSSSGGVLKAMELLEGGYNEMKDLLMKEQDASYQVLNKSSILAKLKANVDAIDKILEDSIMKATSSKEQEGIAKITETLRDRRAELRRKAFQKNTKISKDQEYKVSLEGDFIQIIRGKADNSDDTSDKEEEKLPEETVNKRRKSGRKVPIKPRPSTSTSKSTSDTSQSTSPKKRSKVKMRR